MYIHCVHQIFNAHLFFDKNYKRYHPSQIFKRDRAYNILFGQKFFHDSNEKFSTL